MYSYKEVSELAGFTARVSDMLNVFDDLQIGKYEKATSTAPSDGALTASLSAAHGQVIDNPSIKVENLSIVSPGGDILVKDLSFEVPHGTHVLIVGPNGCGKSIVLLMKVLHL
jgi:ATP-binding cassette subfamily D (ALD) long-chain fatty acid import protein